MGPGLLTFSVFQPYNENVFSLHDPLEPGIDGRGPAQLPVAGWYAEPDSDILAGPALKDFADLLHRLKWSLAPGFRQPSRSVYTGRALGIGWKPAARPTSASPTRGRASPSRSATAPPRPPPR